MKDLTENQKVKLKGQEPNIHTIRFRKLMQLIRLKRTLDKAKITHKA